MHGRLYRSHRTAFRLCVWTFLTTSLAGAAVSAFAFSIPLTRSQRAQKLVEEGQWHILRGDYQEAIDSCTRALGIIDDWAPAYMCRSEARMFVKDEHAFRDAWKAARLDPQNGGPFRVLGIMEYNAGHYGSALMHFNQAMLHRKLKPEDVSDIYYYRSQTYLNLGNFAAAVKDVDQGLGIVLGLNGDYSNWNFYALRAKILRKMGKTEKADGDDRQVISLIDERLRRRPDERPELLLKRADQHTLLREYDEAAKDYSDVLSYDHDNVEILLDRAYAYSMGERQEESIQDLDHVLKLDPRNLTALRMRALARIGLGDNKGALDDLDKYLVLQPEDGSALAHRGIVKKLMEDYRGSLSDLDRAQSLHPEGGEVIWGHKAFVEEMLGNHKAALKAGAKALEADPNDFSAHMARARAGVILKQCADVRPSLDWLVEKSPNSGYYLWLRGECGCSQGKYPECLADLGSAADMEPDSQVLAERLAFYHRRYLDQMALPAPLIELRKSQKFYNQLSTLGPLTEEARLDRARTYFELGQRLSEQGPKDEGAKLLRLASSDCDVILKREPTNPVALELRRHIRLAK